jgi:hypothetical protein
MSDPHHNWWTAIWPGLVVDPDAKHIRRIGTAVWLLLYLFTHARRRTGIVTQRHTTIARRMGIPLRTERRWLSRLAQHGYIEIRVRAPVLTIQVARWKSVSMARNDARSATSGMLGGQQWPRKRA